MKNKLFKITALFWLVITVISCSGLSVATVTVDANTIVNHNYIGNGAQWDPYQLDYGEKHLEISAQDWNKLYNRLDFMKPQFMRVMINTSSLIEKDTLNRMKNFKDLSPILEYCQSRDVKVTFGDWGGSMVNSKENTISKMNLNLAAKYLDFLINDKGFTCIKYYNMVNEPNGDWSVTDGNYKLWEKAVTHFFSEIKALNLDKKVSLMGPDIAIWEADKTDWITQSVQNLDEAIGIYDIHTYPSKFTVNSGEYTKIIKAYKDAVTVDKPIVMGEIGFKFVAKEDALLLTENVKRAKAKPYASIEDSQMFVYDYSYGTDMADALFQTVNTGYSGSVVWMLDDAMHAKEAKNKLKVWGFWNILGDEYFGKSEEEVRPWYYAWSLLTKYMPSESKVFKVIVTGDPKIKAIAISKGSKYMFAIVNVANTNKKIKLIGSGIPDLQNSKKFIYAKGKLNKKGDHELLPNKEDLTISFKNPKTISLPAEGLLILTNFDY